MSNQRTQLENALEELSRWDADTEPTWISAAEALSSAKAGSDSMRHANKWWSKSVPFASIAAAVLFCGLLVTLLLPSLGSARRAPSLAHAPGSAESADAIRKPTSLRTEITSTSPLAPAGRSLIQRFDIELLSPDVRAAFSRLPSLLSEVRGEFIEQSSFSGAGASTTASATLRVPADRLGAVLATLRGLGTLSSESSSGEDVTEQVVDLDARLRNEQRVEKELLSLLESRNGAPLKEILEVRESLRNVREQIERISAQQKRMDRLVSLATIRIFIRTETAPHAPPEPAGFWTTATTRIAATWTHSLRIALDAFAGLLAVVVGGAVWWILLGVFGFIAMKLWRRYQRHAAFEPPPRL